MNVFAVSLYKKSLIIYMQTLVILLYYTLLFNIRCNLKITFIIFLYYRITSRNLTELEEE